MIFKTSTEPIKNKLYKETDLGISNFFVCYTWGKSHSHFCIVEIFSG